MYNITLANLQNIMAWLMSGQRYLVKQSWVPRNNYHISGNGCKMVNIS